MKVALSSAVEAVLNEAAERSGMSQQDLVRLFIAQGLGLSPAGYGCPQGTLEVPARDPGGTRKGPAGDHDVTSRVSRAHVARPVVGGREGDSSPSQVPPPSQEKTAEQQDAQARKTAPLEIRPAPLAIESADAPCLPGIPVVAKPSKPHRPENAAQELRRARREQQAESDAAREEEIQWRLEECWKAHVRAWRKFMTTKEAHNPPRDPTFHPVDIEGPMRAALLQHDGDLLTVQQRGEWRTTSKVVAAGEGIFHDDWCTARAENNNRMQGGKLFLEHWRPWRQQRGKPDPVERFAELGFRARDAERRAKVDEAETRAIDAFRRHVYRDVELRPAMPGEFIEGMWQGRPLLSDGLPRFNEIGLDRLHPEDWSETTQTFEQMCGLDEVAS